MQGDVFMSRSRRFFILILLLLLLPACSLMTKDPRPHGEKYTYEMGDTITTAFFTWSLDSLQTGRNMQNFLPEDRQSQFLACEIHLHNTTSSALPMSYADFKLVYADEVGKEQTLYPLEPFLEGQLPDSYTIAKDEVLSGLLVYEIPKNLKQAILVYQEIYEDNFKGNIHNLHLFFE
mgnify:FL=1